MTQIHLIDGRLFARLVCGECGIEHYVPKAFNDEQLKLGGKGGWHCPNGHLRAYLESEADKLRRERDNLKQQQARYEERLKSERSAREAAERQASARKGQITRLRNRAAAGVCPCCSRSFENLRRHMSSRHPTFKAEEVE